MKRTHIHHIQIKLLTLIVLLFAMAQTALAQSGNWDSYKASGYESGSGTQASPYIIKTAEQLAYFAYRVKSGQDKSAYVELGADIDLSAHWWIPIGDRSGNNSSYGFQGYFDGKGYTISNLKREWGSEENSGFFSYLRGGSVKNIIFDNAYFTASTMATSGARRVGVLVGCIRNNPTIENIIVKNSKIDVNKVCDQKNGWILVGGLIGGNYNSPKISNCYVDVAIDLSNLPQYSDGDTNHRLEQSWFGMIIGGTEGGSQPTMQNIYTKSTLKVYDNLKYTCIGAMLGNNNASNKTAVVKSNCFYENVPTTKDGATLEAASLDYGTKSSSFTSVGFLDIANSYVSSSTNNLELWKWNNGEPSFSKIHVSVRENYTSGSKETSYVVAGTDDGCTIAWTVGDETITPDDGTNNTQITIPLKNKVRTGTVKVTTTDGQEFNLSFTINPKTYTQDGLYAASYAGGKGTKDDPYLIENDLQLARLAYEVNNAKSATNKMVFNGLYFKLINDIDLSAALWLPIGTTVYSNDRIFAGKFLGNSHTISNMRMCWTDKSGVWSTWGMFAQLSGQSANEAGFCSVSDLIIDHASLEKQEGYVPVGNGINLGILVGEANPYVEMSNIIVKNSVITDNEETYTRSMEWQIGGMIANVQNGDNSKIFRIYNLSCDTKINMLKNASIGNKRTWIGGVFGGIKMSTNANSSYQIYPTNIYAHGDAIDAADAISSSLVKGAITANVSSTPSSSTWYYVNEVAGSKKITFGVQKSLADFAKDFVIQNNTYIQDNTPSDSCIWTYTTANGFAFGNTTLTLDRTNGDVITATTPGKDGNELYYWYTSRDRKTWKKVTNSEDSPLLSHTLTLPYQEYDQYVYATLEDESSSSQFIKVEKLTFNATLEVSDDGTYTAKVTNNVWDNNDKFNITYVWEKNGSTIEGTNSPSYNPGEITNSDKISCKITVTDKDGTVRFKRTIYKATVVYLCPADITIDGKTYTAGVDDLNLEDSERGYSHEKPVKTWKGAYSKLEKDASWTENVIVLIGTSTPTVTNDKDTGFNIMENTRGGNSASTPLMWKNVLDLNSPLFRNTTITGSWNDIDYKGQIETGGDMNGLHIFGDTRFENITFNHIAGSYDIIYCQYNNLEMGDGVVMTNYNASSQGYETIDGSTVNSVQIFGGFLNDGRFNPLSNADNIKKFEESMPHGKEGFRITLKSGHFSTVCAGGRQAVGGSQNGVMGTPNMPIKCTITVDIDRTFNDAHNDKNASYDVGTVLAGNHEGAMYADVDIIVRSGTVARVVNGTLGNQRSFGYSGAYTPPFNSYMGRANILIDPASSRFATKDEPIATTNDRVVVTEVYGGSLGRGFENGKSVDNPFYGISKVTINGGTFKILPESNANNANVLSGIYGAGAGGMTGIGDDDNHTSDDRIAYWNSTKDVMLYGDYNTAKDNLVHYQCYNADTQTTTDVDPTETKTNVEINGGVFGTDSSPLDGIYAGGSGYMSPGLWYTNGAIPNTYGGNVYGKTGKTVASLTIKGGTFYCTNGVFAGGRGTDKFFTTNSLNNKTIGGNRADYKELGKTYGNVKLTINGGTFNCPIYGGGYGVADAMEYGKSAIETLTYMARVYGKSTVNINGGTFYKNIYGGGDMALVEYHGNGVATNVNVSDSADVRGSVFGGGNGRVYRPLTSTSISYGTINPDSVGRVIGGTSVTFLGDTKKAPYIYGDIYGGGNLAQVQGDTYVNLYAGNFAGQIFGGGRGNLDSSTNGKNTSADISGNTYVALAKEQGGQEEGDDGQRVDNFSINVIWNQLWDSDAQQFYIWDTNAEKGLNGRANGSREKVTVDKTKFYANDKFLNPHNIYGGGNLACKVNDSTTVIVEKGMTPFELLKTQEWKTSYTDNDNPHFYVFGGGYGANTTVGRTSVTVNVEGDYGIYDAEADDDDEQLARPNKRSKSKRQSNTSARAAAQNSTDTLPVFDNSKGIPNFTILGVLGGGYKGIVTGDTKVTVDGNTFLHRVYGGGFGDPSSSSDNTTGQVGGNTEVYIKGANTYGDIFGGGAGVAPKSSTDTPFEDVAEVLGTTKVQISDDAKVYGNVYGGGDIANVGEYVTDKPSDYYDTSKPTSVSTLNQTDGSFESYEASGYKTFVNIIGGDIFGNVYGGGKGLKKAKIAQYNQVGRINGNALVHIADSDENTDVAIMPLAARDEISSNGMSSTGKIVPYIWNRIYGGCAYGTVDGNTLVHIEGGMLGINIFGGGYGDVSIDNDQTDIGSGMSTDLETLEQVLGKKDTDNKGTYANILGNTKVQIDGGGWLWNRRADINGNITRWVSAEEGNNKICSSLEEFQQIVAAIKDAKTLDDIQLPMAKAAIEKIKNDEDTQKFFDINTHMFSKNHNIFGGGNRACYVGTYLDANGNATEDVAETTDKAMQGTGEAVVEINHSPVSDIEDANGKSVSLLDNTTIQGLCWYLSSKSEDHPQFSVFGAGYGANTKVANTQVLVRPGAYMTDNGQHVTVDGKDYRYINQASDYAYYLAYQGNLYMDFMKVSKEDKKRYYGSSDGGNADGTDNDVETFVRYRASRMAWNLGTPNFTFFEIHGGGFSGYVTGDTYVETDNYLDCRQIFGAGLGAKPYGDYDNSAKYDFGSIGGNAKVFMKAGNVSENVYGGGAGIESVRISGKSFVDYSAKSGEAFDFPDMARVNGKTEVHIYGRPLIDNTSALKFKYDRTLIIGSVYGGGDVANVGKDKADAEQIAGDSYLNNNTTNKFTSLVNIRGAKVFSNVFAGGNGRKKEECADYTLLGGIYGNACVVIDRPLITYPYLKTTGTATSSSTTNESLDPSLPANMAHPADDVNEGIYPVILNRVYGGCQNGTIYGNTLVAVNGGKFGANIFGGGWGACDTLSVNGTEQQVVTSANIMGNTNLSITGGEMELTAYWNPDLRSWGAAEIISGTTYSPQYDHTTRKFRVNHNIYGGGNVACNVGEKDDNGNLVDGSGNTYLTIKKGLLYDTTPILSGQNANNNFFESNEWREVFNKIGSPHFGVFGGGYGENTTILGDTHINIDMATRESIQNHDIDIKDGEEYKHFLGGYSVMDFVGGGYSGKVEGDTHINGVGGAFCRRIFGGGFYNSVNATNVEVNAIDCQDIFGGGLMGDILKTTNVTIGKKASDSNNASDSNDNSDASSSASTSTSSSPFTNADIFIHGNIYGGNDVSGYVNVALDKQGYFVDNGGKGTNINIYGGLIGGNVYGAGNGDYLYALDKEGHTKVTVNEYYPINPNDPEGEKVDLVYTVPMRENMPSYKAASDAAKIVNINSWRPLTNKVNINIEGSSTSDLVSIHGDVYGGGNSATVQKVQKQSVRSDVTEGAINLNIGSHVNIGRVFMGSNGDALFTASEDNDFMNKFQRLNGDIEDYTQELNLADTIDWQNDPSNKGISTLWLSTKNDDRPQVYPHLLDLYFQPVETDIQGTLTWNGTEEGDNLEDCTIGTFCCGGNRGNMNVYPFTIAEYNGKTDSETNTKTQSDDSESGSTESSKASKVGNAFEYTFPAGLTITDKIVGGCNNANYDYKGLVSHEGGYLLGEIHSTYPFIKLNIKNQFQPKEQDNAYMGGNVYGGCYKSGTIRGDVSIVLESDMLKGKSKEKLENSNELLATSSEYSALNVFGAGYGMESYVYGNCYVKMGKGIKCTAPSYTSSNKTSDGTTTEDSSSSSSSESIFNPSGTSANFIYGGGQQGNVIGKTDVKILNGHVFKSVTGGSYSGFVWGSTQIRVGFPKYYVVNGGYGGLFNLNRTDQNNKDIDQKAEAEGKSVASETIKQTIRLIADDVITQSVYDAIASRHNYLTDKDEAISAEEKKAYFTEKSGDTPSVGWDNVNIVIGEAVYGGGYSLAQGGSVMANNTTVLKYTDSYNLDSGFDTSTESNLLKNLGGTTAGFGGNTTILIGDRTKVSDNTTGSTTTETASSDTSEDRDHITISRQSMKEANVANGQDLLGYYYKGKDGNYHYIYQAGLYYKNVLMPDDVSENDENIYEYDNEGGVFGDGHLSYAEGFRSGDLTGYGFASSTIQSPKILNTFQRMDILRLTDNCFSLLGARDYASNAMDKTPYSISRVGEIQMIANDITLDGEKLAASTASHTYAKRARNYMGFANNIHYVGALYSNVSFNDPWHNGKGEVSTYGEATTYQAVKQKYIDDYFKGDADHKKKDYIFEKRNDGTAKNMIGIASGYALKIQNAQSIQTGEGDDAIITDHIYYGPVYGIVEMNLIDVREDEGGGYVYADNVHKRSTTTGTSDDTEGTTEATDFLETTGNFVFPYSITEGRYIVDDCFPKGYVTLAEGENPDEKIEAHYWYVTGYNYHYTAHITGYTFNNTGSSVLKFNSDNQDGIVALSGLKPSQQVTIENWKLYSAHTNGYTCDLEDRNYKADEKDAEGTGNVKDGYKLFVGAADATTFIHPDETQADGELPGFATQLSMKEGDGKADYHVLRSTLPASLTGDAKIVFQLRDQVNNSTSAYYDAHLSEPCKATLILSAPAQDDKGNAIESKVVINKLYTKTGEGDNATYTEVDKSQYLTEGTEYFYKHGETGIYTSVKDRIFYTRDPETGEYTEIKNISNIKLDQDQVYYCGDLPRYYTYTIDLTIDYIQGPDIEGHITVENCALPGEKIRVKKDKVVIKADQSFSVNGYYWRIGKRKKVGDTWQFEDETEWKKNTLAKGYDTFNQSDKEGKGVFTGCYYDKTEDYLDIPAYYYMNGYGIQLGVTMNAQGMEDILPIAMVEADKLVVHNYHRMDPHKAGMNLHLKEAVKRVAEEADDTSIAEEEKLAEPRIYLADQSDLTAFIAYVDTIGKKDGITAIQQGAHAQFVLQSDLTMQTTSHDGSSIADFAGTLHGNGHVISGLGAGNSLFNSISGNVYNLGLSSGMISNMATTNGKMAQYHCCFEYAPTTGSTPIIYSMDGTEDLSYTTEDFRLGKAAYDLNQYYLRARQGNTTEEDKLALKYVYDYFANGDYQYAHRTDAITGNHTGITYLRTGKDSNLPNYEQAETRHDKTHAIDQARAQQYVAGHKDADTDEDVAESRTGDYLPLFNASSADGSVTGGEQMNDFLFWGQSLQSTPAVYPTEISSHQVGYMANRVYRTAGYYGDTQRGEYHYNAYIQGNNYMDTYVHNLKTTAIDFSYQDDNATIFHDFNVKDGVSQNLLVYTGVKETSTDEASSTDATNRATATDAYSIVSKALSYTEATKESMIHGHHIAKNPEGQGSSSGYDQGYSTNLLHLVERTPGGENSEGESSSNNDFCAPIAFTVNNHAWYTRKPQYYANDNTGAWEGICLPFTVHKAEASLNGEITHFYGTPSEDEVNNPAENTHSLHHEYWLRGMTQVDYDESEQALKATFERPGEASNGLFASADEEGNTQSFDYWYSNSFFVDTYEKMQYNKTGNPYYAESRTYRDYIPLTSGVPYIVRFPGERYYEFDLSSKFYNNLVSGKSEAAQTVTFHAFGSDNTTETSHGAVIIPITATMQTAEANGFQHMGIFTATQVAEGSVYGMTADGTAFSDASSVKTVMPFRTYITQTVAPISSRAGKGTSQTGAAAAKKASVIKIAEGRAIDKIVPEINKDNGEEATDGDYLLIHPLGGMRVRIESSYQTNLHVYSTTGQLYRILDVQPGTSTYSGFASGIYIFGDKKVWVK